MNALVQNISIYYTALIDTLDNFIQPLVNVVGRAYVAWVFFASGLTKIRDWESTLMLFEYEYSVPLLSFEVAALLATAGELILPVLLLIGLGSRFSAVGLSIINIVAVISLEEIAPVAFSAHIVWGLVLLYIIMIGGHKLSCDHLLKPEIKKHFDE